MIETKHAIYSIAEGAEANLGSIGRSFKAALEQKNFLLHGPHLSDAATNDVMSLGHADFGAKFEIKTAVTRTEQSFERALTDVEKGQTLKHGLHRIQETAKSITEPYDTGKKLLEAGKSAVGLIGAGGIVAGGVAAATENVQHRAGHAVHKVVEAAGSTVHHVQHVASDAQRDVRTLADSAEKHIEATAKHVGESVEHVAESVKHWSPEMPFEKFSALMNQIRGGTTTPAHQPAQQRAHGVER